MKIEEVDIALLKPAEYNPRQAGKEEHALLKASLETFGLVDPILVNSAPERKNIIIGGHFRVRVAKDLGLKTAPVVYLNIPDIEREQRLNLSLNRNTGSWDYDLLANFDEELLKIVGFDSKELDKIFQLDPDEEAEKVPEPRETSIQTGDVWILGEHRLMCGDSTEKSNVSALVGDCRADMVHTDPPYNVDYGSSKNPRHKIRSIENDSMPTADWSIFCHKIFEIFKEYNNGDIYMWGASGPEGMRMRLWLTEVGCHWSATIIWKKQQLVLSPAKYQRMYEPCFYGWFGKSSYNGDRKQTEVWEIDRPRDLKLHPTMKPLELCERAIENSSLRGDMVLDLFGGAGSTLIACERLKRKCYIMELDPIYCQVIIDRWELFTGKKALKG